MLTDYLIHFLVEIMGQCVLWLAYSHKRLRTPLNLWTDLCSTPWHRPAIWFVGTLATSILTVHLVG